MRQHGLARAGLAGNRVKPLAEAQFRPLNQEQILDSQLAQHPSVSSTASGPKPLFKPQFAGSCLRLCRGWLRGTLGMLHKVPGPDEGEAKRGADKGKDGGDQDDLVEGADEG